MAARLLTIPILLATGLAVSPAFGEVAPCGPEHEVVAFLQSEYGEVVVSQDDTEDGQVVIVRLVNPQTGAYSIVAIVRGKRACLVDAGREGRS